MSGEGRLRCFHRFGSCAQQLATCPPELYPPKIIGSSLEISSPSLFLFFSTYARASITSFCIWSKVAEPLPANSIASNPMKEAKRNALVCPKDIFAASTPTFVAIISSKTFHPSVPMNQLINVINNPAMIDTNRMDSGEKAFGNAPLWYDEGNEVSKKHH